MRPAKRFQTLRLFVVLALFAIIYFNRDAIVGLIVKTATDAQFVRVLSFSDRPGKIFIPDKAIKDGNDGDAIVNIVRGPEGSLKLITVGGHKGETKDGGTEITSPEILEGKDTLGPFVFQPDDRVLISNKQR